MNACHCIHGVQRLGERSHTSKDSEPMTLLMWDSGKGKITGLEYRPVVAKGLRVRKATESWQEGIWGVMGLFCITVVVNSQTGKSDHWLRINLENT